MLLCFRIIVCRDSVNDRCCDCAVFAGERSACGTHDVDRRLRRLLAAAAGDHDRATEMIGNTGIEVEFKGRADPSKVGSFTENKIALLLKLLIFRQNQFQ